MHMHVREYRKQAKERELAHMLHALLSIVHVDDEAVYLEGV